MAYFTNYVILYIFFVMTMVIESRSNFEKSSGLAPLASFVLIFFALQVAIILVVTQRDVLAIKKNTQSAVITLDNRKVTTNKDTVFVGKTNNYLFIYRKKEKTTDVIPIDRVTELKLLTEKKANGWLW